MEEIRGTLLRLLEGGLSPDERRQLLRRYAHSAGWHPSDEILDYRGTEQLSTGHLLVEHGLSNTAVITFLRAESDSENPFYFLDHSLQSRLLSISYNNLVDWHLFPDRRGVLRVFNRTNPATLQYLSLADRSDAWRAEAFEQVSGKRPNANLPALDVALIRTISDWKRILASELRATDVTDAISELFNAIFFVRALEDDRRKSFPTDSRLLLEICDDAGGRPHTAQSAIARAIDEVAPDHAGLLLKI